MLRSTGEYVTRSAASEAYSAFVPAPLPPEPPLELDGPLLRQLEEANRSLGRLDGISRLWPDSVPVLDQLLYQYVRKEAVLSSQIEGTQSSISDLLLYELKEAPGVPIEDVEQVSNYVSALNHGIARLRGGFPLSLRLLREIHGLLLSGSRGGDKSPGEFRRTQNWLGGARPSDAAFVPPPPDQLAACLDLFERFLNNEPRSLPTLIRVGLAHVQFETIHPFLDGNGRLGRMLIPLALCHEGVLEEPLLYLSLYFSSRRTEYYDRLQAVRDRGDWEGWLRFFFLGVTAAADQAAQTAHSVWSLFDRHRAEIQKLGRGANTALLLHEAFQRRPILSIPSACEELKLTYPAVNRGMQRIEKMGIVRELTGKRRRRLYVYDAYLEALGASA